MRLFYRILFVVIAVCIPAVSLIGAFNTVFRLPDLYIYEFNKNQVAREINLGMKDDDLGRFFSDFMKGKEKEFDLFAEYRDREQSVFSATEQANLENARRLLNDSIYFLGAAAVLAVISYWILLAKKKKYELRLAFKGGIIVFAAMLVVFYAVFSFDSTRAFLHGLIFIRPFGADDVVPLMLTEQFAQLGLVAVSAVGLVILVILASVTWRLTKPRRMFW